ncbi:MAG: PQQ-dependent sugar dehydrogenase, partial [Planctomycetota bacterium]
MMFHSTRARIGRLPDFSIVIALVVGVAMQPSVAAKPELEEYASHAMSNAGNAKRGKAIFNDKTRAQCITCHVVNGEGGKVGPDLSKIGGKFDRIHLIESVLEPSRQLVEGYRTSQVLTIDGEVLTGIIQSPDEDSFDLVDQKAESRRIEREDVEEVRLSTVSVMPEGLAGTLSTQEFTDLIAYLESCRTGAASGFGASTSGPIRISEGFEVTRVASGLSGAVGMEVLDDGRVLICEQHGQLRVVREDRLLDEPMLSLDVEHYWERGLIGVTADPRFPEKPWVYVTYVSDEPFSHHVISRFRVDGDLADRSSEQILLEGDDQATLGGFKPSGHQGGGMHFGKDGCLYVGLGEQTAEMPAQHLDTLQGKILRLRPDGTIPKDNPFLAKTEGKYQSIWAIGCRNPFTFAIDKLTGLMLINDVGGKFEEINVGMPGANYGWPIANHGPTEDRKFTGPIHWYPEASISGGDFAPVGSHASLEGRYVFADFVHGWIKTIDPQNPSDVRDLASGIR